MVALDKTKLSALINAGKLDEARTYLGSVVNSSLAGSSDGMGNIVDASMAYMKVITGLNKKYLASIQQTKKLIEVAQAQDAGLEKALTISRLKASL